MQFAANVIGADQYGSVLTDGGASEPTSTIKVEINSVDMRANTQMDSLSIDDTLGQPVTAKFTLINPLTLPNVGDRIRIFYYAQLLFGGTIDRITKQSPDLSNRLYSIDCLDWSQSLYRRKINRTFTALSVPAILNSLMTTELAGETLTLGVIDTNAIMPLIDASNARIFDMLRDLASSTGQTFYVDFDQTINLRSSSVTSAPMIFDEAHVILANTSVDVNRDAYRNTQTSLVTGTPAAGVTANTSSYTETNLDQVNARKAVEGGTGIYEEIEEITHPTSNVQGDLDQLAIGDALINLIVNGTPQQTIKLDARGYGFRSGQVATLSLPTFGVIGSYVIQRVSTQEVAGRYLFHSLEFTSSSTQQRAYESWLAIIRGAKVTVKVPMAVVANQALFTTPGSSTWTVPGGVTQARFTCYGGSGGAGGYWKITNKHGSTTFGDWTCDRVANGGNGGAGGKVISVRTVVPGEVYTTFVGSKGLQATLPIGSIDALGVCGNHTNNSGTAGTASSVKLGVVTMCQAEGGGGGNKASGTALVGIPGTDGSPGAGFGDMIGVGAGKVGGANWPLSDGVDGSITIQW